MSRINVRRVRNVRLIFQIVRNVMIQLMVDLNAKHVNRIHI